MLVWPKTANLWFLTNVSDSYRCLVLHFFLVLWLLFIMFLWNPLWNKKSVKKTFYSIALSTPRCIAGAVLLERRHSGRQTDVQTFIHVYWKSKQKKRIIWLVLGYAQHTFLEFISDGSGPDCILWRIAYLTKKGWDIIPENVSFYVQNCSTGDFQTIVSNLTQENYL